MHSSSIYQNLESSNSLYNQQYYHQLASTNLNQILTQEKQNDADYFAISQENSLKL